MNQNNYFCCTICLKVVIEPRECQTCNTLFCLDCILNLEKMAMPQNTSVIEGKSTCPMRCANPKYSSIHRFSKNELMAKKFKCGNIEYGCNLHNLNGGQNEYCLDYLGALKHLQECQFRMIECPLNCGKMVMLKEYEHHSKTCNNLEYKC